jgi:hypothetical protein
MIKKKKGKKPKEFDVEETFNAGEKKVMKKSKEVEKNILKTLQGR